MLVNEGPLLKTMNFVGNFRLRLHQFFFSIQALRSADDTSNLCVVNSRLKADLIPLNFHQNLTRMRMGVGTKRYVCHSECTLIISCVHLGIPVSGPLPTFVLSILFSFSRIEFLREQTRKLESSDAVS
jgi:hypothetical protein